MTRQLTSSKNWRVQSLLEAARRMHSTIRQDEVLAGVLEIAAKELEADGSFFNEVVQPMILKSVGLYSKPAKTSYENGALRRNFTVLGIGTCPGIIPGPITGLAFEVCNEE